MTDSPMMVLMMNHEKDIIIDVDPALEYEQEEGDCDD